MKLSKTKTIPQDKKIKFFSSFEEMNEADAQEMAAISAIVHLQNATMIAKKVFSEDLKNLRIGS